MRRIFKWIFICITVVLAFYTVRTFLSYFIFNELTQEEIDRDHLDHRPLFIEIDIRPGEEPNVINLNSKGTIPVALLGSDVFDASTVIPESLDMGISNGLYDYRVNDVNGDGFMDFLAYFKMAEIPRTTTKHTSVMLTGRTTNRYLIQGEDYFEFVSD